MKKRYVLKNKKRFFTFIAVVLIGFCTIINATRSYGYKEPEYKTILVRRGDTLWGIAERYNKRGDIRKYIYDVMVLNNLENCDIFEGMELKVIIE
ncbi:MAG TPA: LysM peptidoglycan-binding domain-containing protein [Acetivibrio sp.]|nr:LysM peptidoglycan-binding domain-containing protein [Clostridium sp.]HOQ36711.1 LysM peptidoglycan-binding domain-containing protein [Acetivibrio sp.]HPT90285.1 LysM peptidoglycan-binding domain-containing protein [Acetivibrio sp.]HQA57557.1 LysM peptidoglycan-binding domain-containing protein [Acetivibrio sp.]